MGSFQPTMVTNFPSSLQVALSPQNIKAERVIHTTNDVVHTLSFQANMASFFWVEGLAIATYLLQRIPTAPIGFAIPFAQLFGIPPDLSNLHVLGYLCYPNTVATAEHKLAPHFVAYVFIGYPNEYNGFHCFDPEAGCAITSHHVVLDESIFPFVMSSLPNPLGQPRCPLL